jgi:hypothetical protein
MFPSERHHTCTMIVQYNYIHHDYQSFAALGPHVTQRKVTFRVTVLLGKKPKNPIVTATGFQERDW